MLGFLANSAHATELPPKPFDWHPPYRIQVDFNESEIAPYLNLITIKVTNKTTDKTVYQIKRNNQEEGQPQGIAPTGGS